MRRGATALAALALAAGCAAPQPPSPAAPPPDPVPASYVVLLESDDGTTGSVVVEGPAGRSTLTRPLQGAGLDGSTTRPLEIDRGRIERDFAAALATRAQAPGVYRLYFRTGAAALEPASERMIEEIVADAKARAAADVSIIGHTDTVGESAMNARLGMERARWVAALLRRHRLPAVELTITSHGEADPLVPTPDGTDEVRNRRVEVIVR
jgi:outer membrane protein OmpA-like peptidoglycan-associated protein